MRFRYLTAIALACALTAGCGGDESTTPVSAKELCFSPDSSVIGWKTDLRYVTENGLTPSRLRQEVRAPGAGELRFLFPGVPGVSDIDPSLRMRVERYLFPNSYRSTLERVEEDRVITLAEHLSYKTYTEENTYEPGKRDFRLELSDGVIGNAATQQYRVSSAAGWSVFTIDLEETTKFLGIQSIETPAGVFSACGFESTTTNLNLDGPTVPETTVEWIYRGVVVKTQWNSGRSSELLTSGQVNDLPIK
ncbi:MAG: hypothetical protein I8H77_05880 [Comamonadaceae bacterium]|nr:hypothetical protein [Comamonadaceae bacterium]